MKTRVPSLAGHLPGCAVKLGICFSYTVYTYDFLLRRGMLQEHTQRKGIFISTARESHLNIHKCMLSLTDIKEALKDWIFSFQLSQVGTFYFDNEIGFFLYNPHFHSISYENRMQLSFLQISENVTFPLLLLTFLVQETI